MADYAIEVVFSFDTNGLQKRPVISMTCDGVVAGMHAFTQNLRGAPTRDLWTT